MKQFVFYIILILSFAWLSAPAQLFEYRKLDINSLIQNQFVSVQVNTSFDFGKISNVFDADIITLARTPGVNPLIITLTFSDSVEIVKSRIFTSAGDGIWLIESAMTPEDLQQQRRTYKVLVNDSSLFDSKWDSLEFEKSSVKYIRLTLTKTTDGNYVRLNEWELYKYVSLAYLILEPADITMKPAWQNKIWKVWRASEIDTILIDNTQVKWSSTDTSVAYVDSTGNVFGVAKGKATIYTEYGKYKGKCSVNVEDGLRSTDPGDIIVTHISRSPSIDFVWGSLNPDKDGWPKVGDTVTWQAHVLNLSKHYRKDVIYTWFIDGMKKSGTIDLPQFSNVILDYSLLWSFPGHKLDFRIDPDFAIPDIEQNNNFISIRTYALSSGFYIEESLYNYFREYQHLLSQQTNCWEDWANFAFRMINSWIAKDKYGTLRTILENERYRIDKIIIVPNGSLPLDGYSPITSPNYNDKSVDLIRGFPTSLLQTGIYNNHTIGSDFNNPFYFDRSFAVDMLKARYLIDTKGFDVSDFGSGDVVHIKENGKFIAGTEFLPWMSRKLIHTTYRGLLYEGDENLYIDDYSITALNLISGHRAVQGNYNPPGNSGVYLNDLPENNIVTISDSFGNPLSGANVRVFRSTGKQGVMYGKYYDSIPDMEFTSDSQGRVNLGRCPFDEFGAIFYGMNNANVVILIRVQLEDKAGYLFLDITSLNMKYWYGHKDSAYYELPFNLYPVITSVNDDKNISDDILQIRYNSLNSSATAVIQLNQPSQINLSIYTSDGRLTGEINETISIPGIHEISFDRFNLSTGLYFCRIKIGTLMQMKKFYIY